MSEEGDRSSDRLMSLFCEKRDHGTWTIALGAGHCPERLRAFFDENFETERLLLDFEHLDDILLRNGSSCQKRVTASGDVEVTAWGDNVDALSRWLASSLGSSILSSPKNS